VALAGAAPDEAPGLRRSMLELISRLPAPWRDRFEQPDLLLAPPRSGRGGIRPTRPRRSRTAPSRTSTPRGRRRTCRGCPRTASRSGWTRRSTSGRNWPPSRKFSGGRGGGAWPARPGSRR